MHFNKKLVIKYTYISYSIATIAHKSFNRFTNEIVSLQLCFFLYVYVKHLKQSDIYIRP